MSRDKVKVCGSEWDWTDEDAARIALRWTRGGAAAYEHPVGPGPRLLEMLGAPAASPPREEKEECQREGYLARQGSAVPDLHAAAVRAMGLWVSTFARSALRGLEKVQHEAD